MMSTATGRRIIPAAATALVAVLALAVSGSTATADAAATRPPSGLTPSGRLLWNFEGLLARTFGARTVDLYGVGVKPDKYGESTNFVAESTCPSAVACQLFGFTFATHRTSAFHLVHAGPPATDFGNYPQLITVNGRDVACNATRSAYLIEYADTVNYSLDCLKPNRNVGRRQHRGG
jgi:hypothetical protein